MTWFGTPLTGKSFQPKQKNRFMVQMGNGNRLVSVKSVTKPAATVESKQYRMINHYYNYPGLVKWEPITITFVDLKHWGDDVTNQNRAGQKAFDEALEANPQSQQRPFEPAANRMTSHALWEMLVASGYTPPSYGPSDIVSSRAKGISSPEKAATMELAFGTSLKIHQLHPDGTELKAGVDEDDNEIMKDTGTIKSVETWELHNPIITKISWGELDYGDDGLVEYTLSVVYDFAVHYTENKLNVEG